MHTHKERHDAELEEETKHVWTSQTVDDCRVRAEPTLGVADSTDVSNKLEIFLKSDVACRRVIPESVPSHRLPEFEGHEGRINAVQFDCPVHAEAVPSMLNDELVPRGDGMFDATMLQCEIKPEVTLSKSDGRKIEFADVGMKAAVGATHCKPNVVPARVNGETKSLHLGFVGNVLEFCKNVLPNSAAKEQLASGTEIPFLTNKTSGVDCAPSRGEHLLSTENVRRGRTGGAQVETLDTCIPKNLKMASDKRGVKHIDRLNSATNGKANVVRDRRCLSEIPQKYSGKGEVTRSPSAMSHSSCQIVRPQSRLRERPASTAPRC